MSLGGGAYKGWWSRAAMRHEEGGIHGNPASGHHQRHRHTEPSQWNTYQTRYLPKGGWRGKKGLKISEQNDLSHRPASKQMQCKPRGTPSRELKKVAPEPQRGVTADRHCLGFNLA